MSGQAGPRSGRARAERRTAPDQEATQGDDERGDAHVGHQEAVDRADERADREAGKQRRPQERSVEARTEERGIHSTWSSPMNITRRPDRADREVDVPRHDDQDHPGRRDRDPRTTARTGSRGSGTRNRPPDRMSKTTQMTARATTIPTRRVSTSKPRRPSGPIGDPSVVPGPWPARRCWRRSCHSAGRTGAENALRRGGTANAGRVQLSGLSDR